MGWRFDRFFLNYMKIGYWMPMSRCSRAPIVTVAALYCATIFTFDYMTRAEIVRAWETAKPKRREKGLKELRCAHKSDHHLHQKHLFMQIKFSILRISFVCVVDTARVSSTYSIKHRYIHFVHKFLLFCSIFAIRSHFSCFYYSLFNALFILLWIFPAIQIW